VGLLGQTRYSESGRGYLRLAHSLYFDLLNYLIGFNYSTGNSQT